VGVPGPASGPPAATDPIDRRRLVTEGLGIVVTALGFGFAYGLAARDAGFTVIDAMAMSVIAFAGAAELAAVGYVLSGMAWPAILVLTALLNARHLLYSATIRPWLADLPVRRRAVMAHFLTDEAFALSMAHFRRIGRGDERGYWIAAGVMLFIPWNLATLAGVVLGGQIPDPSKLGIDIIFPAAMIGLAAGMMTGRRELTAAVVGAAIGVAVSLMAGPPIGIVAGGLIGPLVALAIPARVAHETAPLGTVASAEHYATPGEFSAAAEAEAEADVRAAADTTEGDLPPEGPST